MKSRRSGRVVIWTPPGVKHWHGATATASVTHIAIQETLEGKNVEWMEKVSDEQYRQPAATARVNTRVFEIRTYTTPQKMEVFQEFFQNTTMQLFKKYGFEMIGNGFRWMHPVPRHVHLHTCLPGPRNCQG